VGARASVRERLVLVRERAGWLRVLATPPASTRARHSLRDGDYHRLSADRYTALMSDFARAPRVLVVEDDEDIAQALQRSLRLEGYEVRAAPDGVAALEQSRAFVPDLVILDLGLPQLDGIEVAKRLRENDDVPILILTARDAVESRVQGLDSGADDYLVKPFERQELLARLRALLRRRPPRGSAPLRVGDLSLNADTHEVTRGERSVELTQREFELLEYLMRNERIVISRQRLLDEVWGYDPFSTTNTIEVFVSNLRRKLEAGGEPRLLHTIRGAGYVLRA
jgi:DNA-binding response OmpR family regulator